MFFHVFICLFIYLCIDLSIYVSIYQSICPSIHFLSTYLSFCLSAWISFHVAMYRTCFSFICLSSFHYIFVCPSISLLIRPNLVEVYLTLSYLTSSDPTCLNVPTRFYFVFSSFFFSNFFSSGLSFSVRITWWGQLEVK